MSSKQTPAERHADRVASLTLETRDSGFQALLSRQAEQSERRKLSVQSLTADRRAEVAFSEKLAVAQTVMDASDADITLLLDADRRLDGTPSNVDTDETSDNTTTVVDATTAAALAAARRILAQYDEQETVS